MSKNPAGTPGGDQEVETPVDRFEHEIQDLERPLGLGVKQWSVGIIVALGLIGAFFIGTHLQDDTPDPSTMAIPNIETQEPKRTQLANKPRVFRWESISQASSYIVRIQEIGQMTDIIARETPSNWLELTPEEQARLVQGGRYQWSVRARRSDGWPIGEGKSIFSL